MAVWWFCVREFSSFLRALEHHCHLVDLHPNNRFVFLLLRKPFVIHMRQRSLTQLDEAFSFRLTAFLSCTASLLTQTTSSCATTWGDETQPLDSSHCVSRVIGSSFFITNIFKYNIFHSFFRFLILPLELASNLIYTGSPSVAECPDFSCRRTQSGAACTYLSFSAGF